MDRKPPIIVSSIDAERLAAILDALPDDDHPGREELEAELDRADIVEPKDVPDNVVTMNSTVRFQVEGSDKGFSLTLVYPRDQGKEQTISVMAPVGSALLGMTEGDTISWPKPGGGHMKLKIIEVTFQPERAGEYHR